MLIKKLFFPGKFDEAFIYMQKLLLLDEDGAFFYADLGEVCNDLEETIQGDIRFVPTLLFSESELLHTESARLILKNSRVQQAVYAAIQDFPDELSVGPGFVRHLGDTGIASPLDLHVYYSRAYVGADDGLFSIDLDIQTNTHEVGFSPYSKRHDALTTTVSTEYGAINASCGEDGLFTTFGEFGRVKYSEFWTGDFDQSSKRSLRTSWLFSNLLNYQTPTNLEYKIFKTIADTKLENDPKSKSRERTATAYAETENLTDILDSQTNRPTVISLFNAGSFFLVQSSNMEIRQTQAIKQGKKGHIKTQRESVIPLKSRIISVAPIGDHAVVEFYDAIYLITNNDVIKILDGEALSVRTYPESKRVQHLITIVVEEGVYVVSVFDETKNV